MKFTVTVSIYISKHLCRKTLSASGISDAAISRYRLGERVNPAG